MNPIEAMAQAINKALNKQGPTLEDAARAALLALSEAELSDEIKIAGSRVAYAVQTKETIDIIAQSFSHICRSIAEEKDDNCQASPGETGEAVSAPTEPLQADVWPNNDPDYTRDEGRRARGNEYDHYECPEIYKKNGMAKYWLEGWVEGHRETSGPPAADIGYCLCGTAWNVEAMASHGYRRGTCPDCGEDAAFIEKAASSQSQLEEARSADGEDQHGKQEPDTKEAF